MSKRKHAIEGYFQSGARLHAAGRLAEAEQVYRQILANAPNHADSLHMIGVIALQSGQPRAALDYLDRALALKPAAAMYHVNRANALLALRQPERAIDACHAALGFKRNCAEACQTLGHALSDCGRTGEAIVAYQDALRHNPALPGLHNNLGLALRQADRLDEAATMLGQAVRRAPHDAEIRSNLAGVLKELGSLPDAEAAYREALRVQPDNASLHFNLALVLLLAGRFAEGWPEYEWRFRAGVARLPASEQPQWSGEALAGRTVLVRAEQGYGDTIQFCHYVPMIAGGPVVLEVPARLRRLLGSLPGAPRIVASGEALPRFDLVCPLLSMPRLFDTAPGNVPYLAAEPERVAQWRSRIGSHGRRVGLAWQGNPDSQAEQGRSIPLREFLPLAQVAGVRLISLQRHHGLEQLAAAPEVETLGEAFDAGADAFIDTAAVMQGLDLVITSDTAVAHLAGALGRPVWLALQHVPDWRWMLERSDCPWYPSMRLFRQTRRGDWGGVFARMAEELAMPGPLI